MSNSINLQPLNSKYNTKIQMLYIVSVICGDKILWQWVMSSECEIVENTNNSMTNRSQSFPVSNALELQVTCIPSRKKCWN